MITTMKLLNVKDVEAGPWGLTEVGTVGLGCEYEGARYHIWLNPKTLDPGELVYKNPVIDDHKHPAHFRTRRLKTSSQWSQMLIASMLQVYKSKNLLEVFKAQDAKEVAARKAEHDAAEKLERIRNAAQGMHRIVSALESWFQLSGSVERSTQVFGGSDETLQEALIAVIKKVNR